MAAVDYFLKIQEVPGESLDKKHTGEIDVHKWWWGQTNKGSSGTTAGGGTGKVVMDDFSFQMRTNKATPKFFLGCSTGTHYKQAILVCRKAGKEQQEFLKITMSNVLVSSLQLGGSNEDVLPVDTVTFNFTKLEISYAPQNADGTLASPVVHNYDISINSGS
jgi:type VI secretion system secreted protein Hcp